MENNKDNSVKVKHELCYNMFNRPDDNQTDNDFLKRIIFDELKNDALNEIFNRFDEDKIYSLSGLQLCTLFVEISDCFEDIFAKSNIIKVIL